MGGDKLSLPLDEEKDMKITTSLRGGGKSDFNKIVGEYVKKTEEPLTDIRKDVQARLYGSDLSSPDVNGAIELIIKQQEQTTKKVAELEKKIKGLVKW